MSPSKSSSDCIDAVALQRIFPGGSEMARRMRAYDWSRNDLGPPQSWPQTLKTSVRIMLTSRQPMFVWWGEQLINLYNDSYAPFFGAKHPMALGQPAASVWSEIWEQIGPRAEFALRRNEGTYDEALPFILDRNGYPEETYITFSYSSILDDQGQSSGVLCSITDETQRIIGERQMALLRDLAASTGDADSYHEACIRAAKALQSNPNDLPFALIYVIDAERQVASLAAITGISRGSKAAPETVALAECSLWPLDEVLRTRSVCLVSDLAAIADQFPSSYKQHPPTQALALPIIASNASDIAGILVAGLNPLRLYEDGYQHFLERVADGISAAMSNSKCMDTDGQPSRMAGIVQDITERKQADAALQWNARRDELLSSTAARLLESDNPQALVEDLCRQIMAFLDCHAFFNFLVDEQAKRLRLNACAGIPPEEARNITWLDYGAAVCGCVARDRRRILVEDILNTGDLRTDLVKSYGIQAYCCHPLMIQGRLIGTLSFGTRSRKRFSADEIAVMRAVTHLVAIAMHRIETEKALRASEERYRTLFGAIDEGFCIIEMLFDEAGKACNYRFLEANPAFEKHTGLAGVIGKTVRELVPNHETYWSERYGEIALTGVPVRFQASAEALGRHYDVYAFRIGAPAERKVAVLFNDITERKQAENRLTADLAALTQIHRLSNRLLDKSGLAPLLQEIMDAAVVIAGAERGMLQLFEGGLLLIVAQHGHQQQFLEYFANAEKRVSACGEAMHRGERVVITDVETSSLFAGKPSLAVMREAGVRAVQSTPMISRTGKLLGVLTTHWSVPYTPNEHDLWRIDLLARQAADLIESTRADTALRRSEQRERQRAAELQTILDTAPIGLALALDPQGKRIRGNRAHERMFGFSPDTEFSVAGPRPTRIRVLQDGRELATDELPMQRAVRGEIVTEQIVDVLSEDGKTLTLFAKATPLRDESGQSRGAVGAFLDITALKKAEKALREADRRKDEFLATLAHELRNPLAPIRNGLYFLQQAGSGGPAAERVCSMLERQVKHLIRLVDDLLEVSRITRGKIELKKEAIELAAVIRSAVETSQPLIDTAGHVLKVSLPTEPLPLDADPVRLTQVFSNLLNNAAKYMESGGKIELTVRRQDAYAIVSIRDFGIGIPAESLPKVFELFTQIDRSLGHAQGGLGIGLALVRRLVELHGGQVEAHSEGIGLGSEFIVNLPLAEICLIQSRAPDGPLQIPHSSYRLLVVDDNHDAADSLALLLQSLNAVVRVVYNGPAALEALADFQPEVVLLDLGMPIMDGYEVARRMRQDPQGGNLMLIALTGWGQEEDRRSSHAAGFDHHLTKPVDIDILQELLASLESRRNGI